MRAVATLLAAIGVLGALGTGCSSDPEADPSGQPVSDGCSSHIDALIASRIVPNADREYATGMCEQQR